MYINDSLVFCEDCDTTRKINDVLNAFRQQAYGLTFTYESLTERAIQFLNLIVFEI